MSMEHGELSDWVRQEQLRRADAAQVAAELQEQEQQAKAQADAERLAAREAGKVRRDILAREAGKVATAANGNVPENVIQRRGLLVRRLGWVIGSHSHSQQTLEYDFTSGITQVATILFKDGGLKITSLFGGPENPSEASAQQPLIIYKNTLYDVMQDAGGVSQEGFNDYKGYLTNFALDNLNIQ